MAKLNRTCYTCGKEYRYCPDCVEDADKPTWMSLFESENCRTIFNTLTAYNADEISAEDALSVIGKCNVPLLKKNIANEVEELKGIVAQKNNEKKKKPSTK